ncbi:hypothetical protein [Sphingomonas sp. VNH70]|uniref:hypothetical protein n=1 Tax=Sphingomonas silueang TaxID=3156617 RepID=UPI0032B53F3B
MPRRALALALFVAACSQAPDPAPAPSPTPVATPRPTPSPRALRPGELPTPELDGAAPLAGAWRFQASAAGSAALYESNGQAVFAVRCDPRARRIVFVTPHAGDSIRLYVADAAATFPADRIDGRSEAAVTTGQTFLDALVRAKSIGVGSGEGPVARLPGDDAIRTVVRSCRPGGRAGIVGATRA